MIMTMSHRRFMPHVFLVLATLLQVSPVSLRAFESATLTPTTIPAGTIPVPAVLQAEFNGDARPETLGLKNEQLSIFSGEEVVWQSPATWTVIQAEITDLNRDGSPEATLLVWRPFHPWPVDQWLPHGGRIATFHDTDGNSCHIILIGFQQREYREVWAGSAMAEPVRLFASAALNGAHAQELVTLEGSYTDPRSAPAHILKIWEWNGFGFTVVSKLEGVFSTMALTQASDGRILILVP